MADIAHARLQSQSLSERVQWILKKLVKTNSVNRPTAAGDGNIQEEKPENELSKQPLDLVNYWTLDTI